MYEALIIGFIFMFVIGVLMTAGITWAYTFLSKRKDDKTSIIKVLFVVVALWLLPLLVQYGIEVAQPCEFVLNYTDAIYVYGANFTGYHWDYTYDLNPSSAPDYELLHIKTRYEYDLVCSDTYNQDTMTLLNTMYWVVVFVDIIMTFILGLMFVLSLLVYVGVDVFGAFGKKGEE